MSDNTDIKPDHSLMEDVYGIAIGCTLLVVGLIFLKIAGLVTGGMAGLALLLSYVVPLPVGVLFTLGNIPFIALAFKVLGWRSGVKTVAVNLSVTLFSLVAQHSFQASSVNTAFASIIGGTVVGMGVLCLARHHAAVGGTGIVSLWLFRSRGWNMGIVQVILDGLVVASAISLLPFRLWLWSIVSCIAVSLILFAWHRPGRYFTC
ncbi:YitT family protein [Sphingomonas sp. NFX23]|uniref:YitT family protein n=1 Tax=Sphingomonas sp. NFX23 TaxID=2819532 RepID=UPI003CE6A1E5